MNRSRHTDPIDLTGELLAWAVICAAITAFAIAVASTGPQQPTALPTTAPDAATGAP